VGETAVMDAVDIQSLIELCGKQRISILKVDIEGAEFEVFSSPAWRHWMDRVDNVVIEVHGQDAYQVTMAAFKESGFETAWCDELIVAQRPARVVS
jgi:hypothetical protein